jgi:hypothetical protein
MTTRLVVWMCAIATAGLAIPAFGQAAGGYGNGRGYNRGNGGQFDPSQIPQMMSNAQQRQLDRIKSELAMSDDDFSAIQPMVQQLIENQMANRFRRAGGMLRPAGAAGANAGQQGQNIRQALANYNFGQAPSPLQDAIADLQNAVNDPDSSPDLIEAKLAAVRAARERQTQELQAVENQLRAVLTLRQEAVLTLSGLLD